MASGDDILNGLSVNELKREIESLVAKDQRSLPQKGKVFAAIAKLQKFDVLPELVDITKCSAAIADGSVELNRGMSGTKGVPSTFYATELALGALYPGTLTALGNGMYFSIPSKTEQKWNGLGFSKVSIVALKYTSGDGSGILVRAALKKDARIAECDDLRSDLQDNRNRAREAGITDVGAFAACLGFDAFYADNMYDDCDERVYTVLNRGVLLLQNRCVLVPI